ncbi:EutP/PduV family microcompartment system protein [Alkalibacterium psychrotolerans]|uniref:EutP/PduV family microcompartment system protein n=1 Tax=Alkalibacterium indicireducens TaxID=398758 RepID=A0ABP3KCR4_9LACT
MKKIMMIGPIESGKTTLCQRIKGEVLSYSKTQAIQFDPGMIDTPGEFLHHRRYYNALQVTSVEADIIAFISSVSEREQTFPPMFNSYFSKPVIGILTKIDLATSSKVLEEAEKRLEIAGAENIFKVSAYTNEGVEEIVKYLQDDELKDS